MAFTVVTTEAGASRYERFSPSETIKVDGAVHLVIDDQHESACACLLIPGEGLGVAPAKKAAPKKKKAKK